MANTADFLKDHPFCCFCGGQTAAAEIDHQPAKIVFPDKQRPKGLEFPACSLCNRQTSPGEALLAFICRFAGSHRPRAVKDFHRLKDIVRSVAGSFLNLLQTVTPVLANQRGVLVKTGAIDVNDPKVDLELCRIAAKLALAIYYQQFGRAASKDCLSIHFGLIRKIVAQCRAFKNSSPQFPI